MAIRKNIFDRAFHRLVAYKGDKQSHNYMFYSDYHWACLKPYINYIVKIPRRSEYIYCHRYHYYNFITLLIAAILIKFLQVDLTLII